MMRRILTTIACAWLTISVTAQTTYTLERCVSEAKANNIGMVRAENDVAQAREQSREALTNFFPTVSATGSGFISDHSLVKMSLAPGMEMSMLKNGLMGGITAMQPVFAGGQIVNGNKLARVGEDVSRLKLSLSADEVELQTETYYWQIVMLKEKLVTLSRVESQLERAQTDARAAVDAGVANKNDLLQVNLKRNEIAVTRINVENNLSLLRSLLAQYMGHAGEEIEVAYTSGDVVDSPEALFVSPATALDGTATAQLLDKQVEAERLQYKMAVGKNMPTVAVGGGYVYNNLMDKSQTDFVGMATVSIPLSGWWGGSHEMRRKRLSVQQAESQREDSRQLLVIGMQKAWNDVNDAYKQVGIARESIEQSEENLRLNTDYYEAGTCSMSDLLEAQTLYQQSRDSYVEALTNYEIKKREYLQATGR